MSQRKLYIAAYDITGPSRLRKALHHLRHYTSGGQLSVFECFLNSRERETLITGMREILDQNEDRFVLLPLRGSQTHTLGIAVAPQDGDYYYIG
ncbi:MAG: CRISPR-associated endonuclease Cas2 [Thiohalomonadaceae bacterium]